MTRSEFLRVIRLSTIAMMVSMLGAQRVMAQGAAASISKADQDAAAEVIANGRYGVEVTPTQEAVKNGAAAFARLGAPAEQAPFDYSPSLGGALPNPSIGFFGPNPSWGPVDLGYHGGPVIGGFVQWNVYLGCGTNDQTCWGNPQQFITDLNTSRFIHLLDQYVSLKTPKRYPLSNTYIFNTTPVGTYLDFSGTVSWLHAAVTAAGGAAFTGYGNIYHLYLNQGIDVCADPSDCYSPDGMHGPFTFCGYHSYVDFGDYGHTLFTVEPYQAVSGCDSSAPDLTSATGNVLSHEIFEAITDPDITAWYGTGYPIDNAGEEIGDQCVWLHLYPQKLGRHVYVTQNEYSNKYHSCAAVP